MLIHMSKKLLTQCSDFKEKQILPEGSPSQTSIQPTSSFASFLKKAEMFVCTYTSDESDSHHRQELREAQQQLDAEASSNWE